MKKKNLKRLAVILGVLIVLMIIAIPVFADTLGNTSDAITSEVQADNSIGFKAIAAAIAITIPAGAGAISMGLATKGSAEGIARQPEAAGEIRTQTMLGFVFIETAIIYALLAVILIIFVL